MADHQPTGTSQNAVFQKVAEIIYPVAMASLLVWFLASILSSIAFTWVFHSGSVEPDWFDPLRRAAAIVGQALQHADGAHSKLLEPFVTILVAIVLGPFLARCTGAARGFEVFAVICLLVFGLIQLVVLFALPTLAEAAVAADAVAGGDELVKYFNLLLSKNSNVALAVCGAALGINISSK
jgi:hypothetical protein